MPEPTDRAGHAPESPPATERVRGEWLRRVEAEYRSAAVTQHLTLWLIQVGASPDLCRAGLRIVDDELAHAELSHAVYLAAGGSGGPAIDRDSLGLERHPEEPLELDVVRAAVQVFCLGETVAVPLFRHLRDGCTQPAARAALDRILRDEVRHRDFGWDLLDWLLERADGQAFRELIDRELAGMFAFLEESYGDPAEPAGAAETAAAADRAWGLAPAADYAAILARTFERDFSPRFARHGSDAGPAWGARLELASARAALAAGAGDRP